MTSLYVCVALVCAAEVRAAYAGAAQSQPLYRAWNPPSQTTSTPALAEYQRGGLHPREHPRRQLRAPHPRCTTPAAATTSTLPTPPKRIVHRRGGLRHRGQEPDLCGSVPFYRLFAARMGTTFTARAQEERDGSETSGWAGMVFPPDADTGAGGGRTTATHKDTVTATSIKTSTSTDTAKRDTPYNLDDLDVGGTCGAVPPGVRHDGPGGSRPHVDAGRYRHVPRGTSGTMRLRLHLTPVSASYLVAAIALTMGGWL
ncbi:hypothetical protein B0H13DRAFT_2508618 [Mycena leptocephala]|nr:hypothetical protein B0H13DRAFT_2508618 [Mycena leptocephala]